MINWDDYNLNRCVRNMKERKPGWITARKVKWKKEWNEREINEDIQEENNKTATMENK